MSSSYGSVFAHTPAPGGSESNSLGFIGSKQIQNSISIISSVLLVVQALQQLILHMFSLTPLKAVVLLIIICVNVGLLAFEFKFLSTEIINHLKMYIRFITTKTGNNVVKIIHSILLLCIDYHSYIIVLIVIIINTIQLVINYIIYNSIKYKFDSAVFTSQDVISRFNSYDRDNCSNMSIIYSSSL